MPIATWIKRYGIMPVIEWLGRYAATTALFGAFGMIALSLLLTLADAVVGTKLLDGMYNHPHLVQAFVLAVGGINATAYMIEENWSPRGRSPQDGA